VERIEEGTDGPDSLPDKTSPNRLWPQQLPINRPIAFDVLI